MNRNKFAEIFADDHLGLLDISDAKQTTERTPSEQRLISSFEEINNFYEENEREPKLGADFTEFMLASRLQGIRNSPQKVKILLPFDFYDLLKVEQTKSVTIEDLLRDDPLNLLNIDEMEDSIFSLKHVKKTDRIRPDYISRRNICENFDEYEGMFEQVHTELKSGVRKLVKFSQHDLSEGKFFVLRGILLYLEKSEHTEQEKQYDSGVRIRKDGRTHCVFDNGTESDMLYRSLYKALLKDGFGVSEPIETVNNSVEISDDDVQNGYIYVLKSMSADPNVSNMKDLYKIGMCSGDVTERIKNAPNEPTYLMSQVQVELTVRCYNINVLNLEATIHSFFNEVNVLFEVIDKDGNKRYPKEWFVAPLPIIQEAIQLIVEGKIHNYEYDSTMQAIIQK